MPLLDTLTRPSPTDQRAAPSPHSLPRATCAAAIAVAGAGLLVAVGFAAAGWIVGGRSGLSLDMFHTGAALWLTAHGGAPAVDGTTVSLLPLLVPVLLGVLGARAGTWAVAHSAPSTSGWLRTTAAAGAGAGTYAAVVGLVGWLVGLDARGAGSGVEVDALRALGLALPGALLVLGAGIARASGTWAQFVARSPLGFRAIGRGCAAAVVTLLAASALVLLTTLAVHADRVLAVGAELAPGPAGGVGLAVVCAATVPNAVLWTLSYVVGPGFAVGTGTVVAPGGVVVGALPAYPLVGALPQPGQPPGWVAALTALPVLAGVVGGLVCARVPVPGGLLRLGLRGIAAGASAGLALAGLMWLSGGAVGPGRMGDTGPVPATAVVVLVTLSLAAGVGAIGYRLLEGRWASRPWRQWGRAGR